LLLHDYLLIEEGDAKLPAEERVRRLGQSAETFAEWQKG